ncbi:MAG: hypothetical protein J6Y69_10560 [Treponema sp.]|nr:hypothetical protein [Treponema sp.]
MSEYTFLVQVKGSRNYYDYQIQTVRVENNNADMGGGQQINPLPGGNTVIGVYDPYGNYIKDNELIFTFGYVPANQKYTVMLDMFAKQDDKNYLVMKGKSRDVEVKRGQPATVELDVNGFTNTSLSPLYIKVEYENGNSDPISNSHLPPYGTSTSEGGTVFKKYGKLWYEAPNNEPQPIKSIYYALDSNSNFPESSYKYSIPYGMVNEIGNIDDPNYITFDGDRYSLEDFLLNYRGFPAGYAFGEVDGNFKIGSLTSGYPAKISKGNFSFIECAPAFTFKSEDEVVSGHTEGVYTFNRCVYDDGKVAYAYPGDLYSIIGNDDISISDITQSSVVLVLTMKGRNPLPNSTQLYYHLPGDDSDIANYVDNDIPLGQYLFSSSQCINHDPGETRFVIPLNEFPMEYSSNFFLAIKGDSTTPSEDLNISLNIDWYYFPEDMNAHIFKVSKPEGDSQYRYQMDKSAGLLSDGFKPNSSLYGEVCFFDLTSKAFVPAKATLNSELYYFDQGIFYAVPETQKQINTGVVSFDSNDPTCYYLEYELQSGWGEDAPYCSFSCYMPCNDRNILLIIRNCSYYFSSGQA